MLRDIVKKSKSNNSLSNVTGYLIFDGNVFLQILEGDITDLKATYQRIEKDQRHTDSFIISAVNVPERDFPGWTMAGMLQKSPIPPGIDGDEAIMIAKNILRNSSFGLPPSGGQVLI